MSRTFSFLRPAFTGSASSGPFFLALKRRFVIYLPLKQARHSSYSSLESNSGNERKAITLSTLNKLYKRGEPITALTAHDFPSGHVVDMAGVEIVLVGDSLAMVAMGLEGTSEVLIEEMLLHCRSVSRAVKTAFTV